MNTLWKGIEKIYNFRVKGLAKFDTQNQQNAINLLLLLDEQNWAGLQQQNGRTEQEDHWERIDSINT
jgi:hypothetical protein